MSEIAAVSDIADRLRNGPKVSEWYEAADEIDHLRAINAELEEGIRVYIAELRMAHAINADMLAALEHIGDRVRGPNDTLKGDIDKIASAGIAKAKGE